MSGEAERDYTQADIDHMLAVDSTRRVVVVHGVVFDVTQFAPVHPGGEAAFSTNNGKDVSKAFDSLHSARAKESLHHWAIGRFSNDDAPSGLTLTGSGAEAKADTPLIEMKEINARLKSNPKLLILVMFGDAYDITAFAQDHPGGTRVLVNHNGKECGDVFMRIHGLRARAMVAKYFIGHVRESTFTTSPLRQSVGSGSSVGAPTTAPVSEYRKRASSTRLLSVEAVATTSTVRCLTFAAPFKLRVPPGGHIKVFSDVDKGEGRFYTPYATDLASFSLCVKHYPSGVTSSYLFGLQPGDEVFYEGPFAPAWLADDDVYLSDARLAPDHKHVLLLAGGTGVSPLYTIAKDLLQRQICHVTLVFSVVNQQQLLLSEELAELEGKYNARDQCRFSIFVAFSSCFSTPCAAAPVNDECGLRLTKANTLSGKVTAKSLMKVPLPKSTQAVVVCGPPSFNEAMRRCSVEAGVCAAKQVHVLE